MHKIDPRVVGYFIEKYPDDEIELSIKLASKTLEGHRKHVRFALLDLVNALGRVIKSILVCR